MALFDSLAKVRIRKNYVWALTATFESNILEITGSIFYDRMTCSRAACTKSRTAAIVFIALLTCTAYLCLNGCQQAFSRLTWAFARDNALIGSKYLGQTRPVFGVPVWSLVATAFAIGLMGFVYLASSTAFNALIGTGLILQQISFCLPAVLLLYRRRTPHFLPLRRWFNPGVFG